MLFNIFLLFLGIYWTNFVFNSGQLSPDLSIPMWIVYAILPLTCIFHFQFDSKPFE